MYRVVTAVEGVDLLTPQQAADALADLHRWTAPAGEDLLIDELTRLRLKVSARPQASAEWTAQLQIYINDLRKWPADLALAAIRRSHHYWPTWAELEALMEPRLSARTRLMEALRQRAGTLEPVAAL